MVTNEVGSPLTVDQRQGERAVIKKGTQFMTVRAVWFRRGLRVLSVFFSVFSIVAAWGQSVSLAWDPSPNPGVAGYNVYYGLASGNYISFVNAGANTSVTMSGLTPGQTYYFAVLAYDSHQHESPPSNEVSNTVPMPPVITSEPPSQTVIAGATAVFAVSASGPGPMSFQWFEGGTALPGATNAVLTVPNVSDANGGGYSVVISSSTGSVTSSEATLSVIDPPVITSQPVAQSAGVNENVVFQVAVSGTPPLTFQWYDGGTPIAAGTAPTLHLANARNNIGPGRTKGTEGTLYLANVSGANAGNYYVTVQNAAGAATSANAALTITNAFALLAGTYNGLFYQTNGGNPGIAVPTAGMLGNCVVGTSGTYSAGIQLGGFSYPLTGVFNAAGNDSEVVSRAANGLANLNVTLNLDMTGATETITGSVSSMDAGNPWTAPLVADLAANTLPLAAGNFGMLLPPEAGATNSPTTDGDVLITSASNGIITLAGWLADETAVSQTVPVSQAGTIPLYCSLYGGLGLAEGWISLAGGVPTGTITWIRPAGISSGLPFPPGFTNVLTVSAAKNFARQQYVHTYVGTSATITPTAGDCLVAFAQTDSIAPLTISDGVNTWVTQRTARQTSEASITVVAATALNVAGTAVTVSVTGSSADAGITVIEYSGVTGIDTSAQATTTSTLAVVLNTTQTDMFVCGWGNEAYGDDIINSETLNPGNLAPDLVEHDTGHYDAVWDDLNSGAGFSAGTYTNTFAGATGGCLVVVALQ